MKVNLEYQRHEWVRHDYENFDAAATDAVKAAQAGHSFIRLTTEDGTVLDVHTTQRQTKR